MYRAVVVSAVAAGALTLAACTPASDGSPGSASPTPDAGPGVTVTVAQWGNFNLSALADAYMADHPGVTIALSTGDYAAQHEALTNQIVAGADAPAVAVIEEAYMPSFVSRSDGFVNLLDLGAGTLRDGFMSWKWAQASNANQTVTIALPADVGGLALCYRSDLLAAAGLPSEPAALDAAVGDTWEGFLALGKQYQAKAGEGGHWIDDATTLVNAAQWQLGTGHGYYDRTDTLSMTENKPAFDIALAAVTDGLSAALAPLRDPWAKGLADGSFATTLCPTWMLSDIRTGSTDPQAKWAIADLPGPGGNWGGSYYALPNQSDADTLQAAYDFIVWLTLADQQRTLLTTTGAVPSLLSLVDDAGVATVTSEYFGGAHVGTIMASNAADIERGVYLGPKDPRVRVAVEAVIGDVEAGRVEAKNAWTTAIKSAKAVDAS